MANIKSAIKRIRTNKRNQIRNKQFKSVIRTNIKKFLTCESENKQITLRKALSCLDKAVNKGILKKNTASRKKSLLVKNYNKDMLNLS